MSINSTEDFILFSEFPTDIQRLIFEEAFEESQRKAIHLALVSHEVRSWYAHFPNYAVTVTDSSILSGSSHSYINPLS